jgi:flagellar hook-associated protein 2
MAIATFSGLATGIDTSSLIQQLVQLERRPIDVLADKQTDLNKMSGRLGTIRTQLDNLKSAAQTVDSRSEVLFSKASSSDDDALGVKATGGAALGTFTVEVTELAASERTYSNPMAAKNQIGLFGTGNLRIGIGSVNKDITVEANDTLETLASKINSSGAAVRAAVVYSGTEYRLQVSGNETGEANAITFTETGTTLGLDDIDNQIVAAADSEFIIDGFLTVRRGSNSVSDALTGVTFELKEKDTGPVTVTVSRDSDALKGAITKFVDSYNAVTRSINAEFAFTGQARVGDSLSGDSALRGLQTRLRNVASTTIEDFASPLNRLSGIGITTGRDGTLTLDATKLQSALESDPEGVSKLLVGDESSDITGMMEHFTNLVTEYTTSSTGILASRIKSYNDRVRDIDKQMANMELRLDKFEENLRLKFANLEEIVSGLQSQGQQMTSILNGG